MTALTSGAAASKPKAPESAERDGGLRVVVACGGPGAEREVSLNSGGRVADALRRSGYDAILGDVTPCDLSALDCDDVDVVFPILHGIWGEDGQFQRVLENRGIPFCGSGSEASEAAFNKAETKRRALELGIATPVYQIVDRSTTDPPAKLLVHEFPLVVKPVAEGSSVNCFIVRDERELDSRIDLLLDEYASCMIEAYVRGPELTVGIVGSKALPVIEIRTKRDFYDYEAKYIDDETEYRFDIELPDEWIKGVQDRSLALFDDLGCRDLARVDWIVDPNAGPLLLEINTLPGMTDHSLLPKAANRAGIEFDQLCQAIVEMARSRVTT
jgi:D-alanine-D-alanine ligase